MDKTKLMTRKEMAAAAWSDLPSIQANAMLVMKEACCAEACDRCRRGEPLDEGSNRCHHLVGGVLKSCTAYQMRDLTPDSIRAEQEKERE